MCKSLMSPRDDIQPEANIGEAISACDLYLMDAATKQLLPNREYRIIHAMTGKKVLGQSDEEGKISTKFNFAHVEVLPVSGKRHLDGAISSPTKRLVDQHLGHLIETDKDMLLGKVDSINHGAPLPIANGVNQNYMDWLQNKGRWKAWDEYRSVANAPHLGTNQLGVHSETVTGVKVSGSPSVPKNAVLVETDDLMGQFKVGADPSEYRYLNLLENSNKSTDVNVITHCFMDHINNGNLPTQYFYVLAHGNPNLLAGYDEKGKDLVFTKKIDGPRRLYEKIISKGYTPGQTLVFLACHLGNGKDSFAEQFSRLSDIGTIYAFTGFGWWAKNIQFYCAASYIIGHNQMDGSGNIIEKENEVPAWQIRGHWRVFNSATATIKI